MSINLILENVRPMKLKSNNLIMESDTKQQQLLILENIAVVYFSSAVHY